MNDNNLTLLDLMILDIINSIYIIIPCLTKK